MLDISELTPEALKARFKARCAATNSMHQNWQIRVHRSLSWFRLATELQGQPEAKYLFHWIALNALYGRWDGGKNAPDAEAPSRREFLAQLQCADADVLAGFLRQTRPLVRKILGNAFLSPIFWRDPANPKAKGWATADVNYLERNLKNQDYVTIVEQALSRLFVLRSQIVHGASTGGSKLNRSVLQTGIQTLEILVPRVQHSVIIHRCGDQWPDLCYPPV